MIRPPGIDVTGALGRLPHEVRDTPCVRSRWLSEVAGHEVWLKLESLQPTHSFKVRGAANAVALLAGSRPAADLVTASAGNHGAALAWAAARAGLRLTVFAPRHAPRAKLSRIAAFGALLRLVDGDYDEAERQALTVVGATGATYVSPYDDPAVIAGAGTIALEVMAQVPGCDEIVVPLGGGGLASGIGVAVGGRRPPIRVVAAEPARSPAFTTALRHGRITRIEVGDTIADGLAGNIAEGSMTYGLVSAHVDRVVTVSESTLCACVADLLREEHLVVEGAAAAAIGAVLARHCAREARHTVVIVSGANIDPEHLCRLVREAGPGVNEDRRAPPGGP